MRVYINCEVRKAATEATTRRKPASGGRAASTRRKPACGLGGGGLRLPFVLSCFSSVAGWPCWLFQSAGDNGNLKAGFSLVLCLGHFD